VSYEPRVKGTDFHILCWNHTRISEGDFVLWKTTYGWLAAEVVKVKPYLDPPDMYAIDVKVVRRYDHGGDEL